MPLCLHKLNLSHFRNYEALRLNPGGAGIVVLTGRNGSGKTNLLEAVSLLSPGRGLRGAELGDMQERQAGSSAWAVSAEIETAQGVMLRVGTGLAPGGKEGASPRRIVRINGRDAKSQADLSSVLSAVWLTPQMDRLFIEGPSQRRRFLDRLVFAFDPEHALRVSRAEKNMRERLKLLQSHYAPDPLWLSTLEAQLAADFSAIAASRLRLVEHLQFHVEKLRGQQSLFPAPLIAVSGGVEGALAGRSALLLEEELKVALRAARVADTAAGRTALGTHRTDLSVTYGAKAMPAAQCSTGEQKGLLVAIVLAHVMMMRAEKGFVPLLLLDEVAAHLDEARREQLFGFLGDAGGQVWLTGTDEDIFRSLRGQARFFEIEGGQARASSSAPPPLEAVS